MALNRLSTPNCIRNLLFFGSGSLLLVLANILSVIQPNFYHFTVYLLFAASSLFTIGVFWDLFTDFRKNISMILFVVAFHLLLLGRVDIAFLLKDPDDLLYNLVADSYQNLFIALQIVIFGFLFAYLGYKAAAPLFYKRETALENGTSSSFHRTNPEITPIIRQLSELFLLISSISFFLILLRSVLIVFRYGYLGSYTKEIENTIPTVISRLSTLFVPSFAVFLATLPNKRQLRLPVLLYTVYMFSSLLTGRRNTFVCEALMLLVYFLLRRQLASKGKIHWKAKQVVLAVLLLACAAYALQMVAELRNGSAARRNIFSTIINFIYSQGATFRVIMQTVNCWDLFDHQTAWQFLTYPFTEFVHNNLLTRTIFGFSPLVNTQNTAYVLTNYNLGHTLTYLYDPNLYLSGGGFGTSYLAETYLAAGLGGVSIFSALLGLSFRFFSSMLTRPWPVLALSLILIRDFFYIPRNFAFNWIFRTFSITYLLFFIFLYVAALFLLQYGSHLRKTASAPEYALRRRPDLT